MTKQNKTSYSEVCYLCGQILSSPTNRDHVPPQQLWTPEIRKQSHLELKTIEVHKKCNSDYQLDEDYFFATIVPFAKDSAAGKSHFRKLTEESISKEKVGLKRKIHEEFDFRPSGIILPHGRVAKRFEADRVDRVIWKIVRGLHFLHSSEVLPVDWFFKRDMFYENPPEDFCWFMRQSDNPEFGDYPGVFSYRFKKFSEPEPIQYWALLFLDSLIVTIVFQDPQEGNVLSQT